MAQYGPKKLESVNNMNISQNINIYEDKVETCASFCCLHIKKTYMEQTKLFTDKQFYDQSWEKLYARACMNKVLNYTFILGN